MGRNKNLVLLYVEDYTNEVTNDPEQNTQLYDLSNAKNPFLAILQHFPFKGDKSLRKFLEGLKEEIFQAIDDEDILDKLERQKFLNYLDLPWFEAHEDEPLSPEDILELGLKYNAFDDEAARNYLLEKRDDTYYTFKDLDIVRLK